MMADAAKTVQQRRLLCCRNNRNLIHIFHRKVSKSNKQLDRHRHTLHLRYVEKRAKENIEFQTSHNAAKDIIVMFLRKKTFLICTQKNG